MRRPRQPDGITGASVMLAHLGAAGSLAWAAQGACRGEDPELFFPIAATGPALGQIRSAKAICCRCAVQAACLSYAMTAQPEGIWGGTTRDERMAARQLTRVLQAVRERGHDAVTCPR